MIPQHIAPPLSELDLKTARAVPPGGNWKNVPLDIPLKRLDTIRDGFARGTGSRSTYYGRLRPDRPSYTINTYFTRPGNGCHLHYDYDGGQHRTLTFREAARLQSFPDDFVFSGSKTSIAKQIGNAVPPLLGYAVAKQLGEPGCYVDLFAGAGGLSLGFRWAGWTPLVANEIEPSFADTYRQQIHDRVVVGDIMDKRVFEDVVGAAIHRPARLRDRPLYVIGGPPCQGFSTAGKRRTMDDERNHLFLRYRDVIRTLRPDGFVFENVGGLLNMDRGLVFKLVHETLSEEMPFIETWILGAEKYAIPQRRTRVVLVGHRQVSDAPRMPDARTTMGGADLFDELPSAVTVSEAIDDLPALCAGEDGSTLAYRTAPQTSFQHLMRGLVTVDEYLSTFG